MALIVLLMYKCIRMLFKMLNHKHVKNEYCESVIAPEHFRTDALDAPHTMHLPMLKERLLMIDKNFSPMWVIFYVQKLWRERRKG